MPTVAMPVFALTVFAAAAWYFMTPEDRARFVVVVRRGLRRLHALVLATCFVPDPLTETLRARTRWIVVVPAVAAINVVLFARTMVDAASVGSHRSTVGVGCELRAADRER